MNGLRMWFFLLFLVVRRIGFTSATMLLIAVLAVSDERSACLMYLWLAKHGNIDCEFVEQYSR